MFIPIFHQMQDEECTAAPDDEGVTLIPFVPGRLGCGGQVQNKGHKQYVTRLIYFNEWGDLSRRLCLLYKISLACAA